MNSEIFNLNSRDFAKGLAVAVLAAVFTFLASAFNAPGFDFGTFNWQELLRIAAASGIGYIAKNFVSDGDGKILGSI